MASSETNKNYYQTLKSLHRCVRCRNQDARTLIGKPLCFDCLEKKREEAKGYDQTESHAKHKQKCIDTGMCIYCGKRKTDGRHKTCKFCLEKYKKIQRDKRISQGYVPRAEAAKYGLCSKCQSKPVYANNNTCFECYTYIVNKFKNSRNNSKWSTSIKTDVTIKEWYCDKKEA